jgi:hypothetical protein
MQDSQPVLQAETASRHDIRALTSVIRIEHVVVDEAPRASRRRVSRVPVLQVQRLTTGILGNHPVDGLVQLRKRRFHEFNHALQ